MIIKGFLPEIILIGTFYILLTYSMNIKKMKISKKVTKPYYLMSKKELANLELEVDNNLDLRAEVQTQFNNMLMNGQISDNSLDRIKELIKNDIKGYKGARKADKFINNCLKNEYISNTNLNIIKDVLDLEAQSFFNSKPYIPNKKREKAKVIQVNFTK